MEIISPTGPTVETLLGSEKQPFVEVKSLPEPLGLPKDEELLVVSPYHEVPHLLDLRTLDVPNQLLAKALMGLKCLRDDYATAEYIEIFNWSAVIDSVRNLAASSYYTWKERSFYIVVFRSRIPPTTVTHQ